MPIPDEIKKYVINGFHNKEFLKADRNLVSHVLYTHFDTNNVDRKLYRKTIDFFKANPHLVNDAIDEDTGKRLIHYAANSHLDDFFEDVIKISSVNLNIKRPDANRTILYTKLSLTPNTLPHTISSTKLLIKHGAKIDNLNDRWYTETGKNNQETELEVIQRYSQDRNGDIKELGNELLNLITEKNFSTPEAYQEFRRSMDVPSQNTTMSEGASGGSANRGASN